MGVPPSLNRLFGMPSSVIAALRVLPDIAAHTEAMVAHTAMLERIADGLDRVAVDTRVLDALHGEMARVRERGSRATRTSVFRTRGYTCAASARTRFSSQGSRSRLRARATCCARRS
jgi:hypothetical protein